jgi:TolB protein
VSAASSRPRLLLAAAALLAGGCGEPEAAERARERAAVAPAPDAPGRELAAVAGEIVFISERAGRTEIHAVRPDGSGRRVVARAPEADFFPTRGVGGGLLVIRTTGGESPAHREELLAIDGAGRVGAPLHAAGRIRNPSAATGWIAFESDHQSFRDVYRVPLAGGAVRRLTDSEHGNFEPAVSPDGKQIAFTSSRDGNAEVYVMASDGSKETRLTAFHRDDWSPAWSPSGDAIAFLSAREGTGRVFLMRPEGTHQERLLAAWDDEIEEETPIWSPDGSQLALVARRSDGTSEVWVADRAGKRRPISPDRARDTTPAWSPDGRYLVFASKSGRDSFLAVARADGSGSPVRITRDGVDWLPRWIARAASAGK